MQMYRYPFRKEAEEELHRILEYWQKFAIDQEHGGFYGRINNDNVVDNSSEKGSVLNARILWTFSSAFLHTKKEDYLNVAERAFKYLRQHFIDPDYGGVYWTVNFDGTPADTRKQLYATAFALYGVSEYCRATGSEVAKSIAIELYNTIVRYGYDSIHGGFFEAFTRDWKPAADQRLSSKDANEKKSTNTNLHIVEAFANLYQVWPDASLKKHIASLLEIFDAKIIDQSTGHLHLFFDEEWNSKPDVISYGHDIEAAWLLMDCANVINDEQLIKMFRLLSIKLADAAMEGLHNDGGLWYEFDPRTNQLVKQKHWWPQAEAFVGFYHAWQLTHADKYYDASVKVWQYIQSHIICSSGEWYWGRAEENQIMNEDKVGLWKCPYHNSRACLEMIKRSLL